MNEITQEEVINGEKKAFDWDTLTEEQKKKARRELRKTIGLKFAKIQRELKQILSAIKYEVNHFGRISPDNEQRRDKALREMLALMNATCDYELRKEATKID